MGFSVPAVLSCAVIDPLRTTADRDESGKSVRPRHASAARTQTTAAITIDVSILEGFKESKTCQCSGFKVLGS